MKKGILGNIVRGLKIWVTGLIAGLVFLLAWALIGVNAMLGVFIIVISIPLYLYTAGYVGNKLFSFR